MLVHNEITVFHISLFEINLNSIKDTTYNLVLRFFGVRGSINFHNIFTMFKNKY